jgi:hypothetical protein
MSDMYILDPSRMAASEGNKLKTQITENGGSINGGTPKWMVYGMLFVCCVLTKQCVELAKQSVSKQYSNGISSMPR